MSVFLSARGEAALVVSNGNSHFGSHISIPSIFYLRLQSQTFLPLQNATALVGNHHPEELPLHSTQNRGDFEMLQDSLLWLWKRRLQIPSCCSRVFAFGLTYFTLQPTNMTASNVVQGMDGASNCLQKSSLLDKVTGHMSLFTGLGIALDHLKVNFRFNLPRILVKRSLQVLS